MLLPGLAIPSCNNSPQSVQSTIFFNHAVSIRAFNGVEAFLYCQLEGAVGDETVTLARQQSTDIFFLVR